MSSIYKDSLIEITDTEIIFFGYYFPTGRERRVPIKDIESIRSKRPTAMGGRWRLWGTGDFKNWAARDYARPTRDRIFIARVRGHYWTIGFTVENSARVTEILTELGLLREDNS